MSVSRYTARKSIQELQAEAAGQTLRRALGVWDLIALGIGAIIGAGIFVITGTASAQYAGPGIMLSFVLGAIACGFVGLCYAEFATLDPGIRQRLYLRLRHPWRARRLDDRLGPYS